METHALRGFSLEIDEGEFVAVTGPSGSGKTTFLNIAGLLDTFDQRHYCARRARRRALSRPQLSQLRNEKIGFIFQSFNLIPDLDVFDNVDVPLRYRGFGAAERKRRIEEALQRVGLSGRAQPLAVAALGRPAAARRRSRARWPASPRLLLADEPTGNLDSAMAQGVMDLLEHINAAGTTIVMVTHDPELAARAKREVKVLDDGVIHDGAAG